MNTTAAPPILERISVLGDETRTRILSLLERSEFTVSELCSVLQTPQPTVSRHLKTLASEGWVEARAEGRKRHYRLSPGLDDSARALWRIVREEIGGRGVYAADAERARAVLEHRRLRSTRFFAESAEAWDEMRAELYGSVAGFAPLLGLVEAGWTVGDLGTGTGLLASRLAPFAKTVVAVDRSEEMLAAARVRLEGVENVELRLGHLEDLPVEDGELDVAVLALVLHYVVDPPVVLDEVLRALTPGGRLLLLDMRRHQRGAGFTETMGHVWPGFESERLAAWLVDAGFVAQRVVHLPHDPEASGPLLFLASARRPSGQDP
ncbi:MAG: metalloregulator ArsR/SmtB family transcription factor [Longimicrobiales bacterium]|nr:metalloregulator ArsR/SmtB family transcription factor [Longimicrobiales bacterium]